MTTRSPSRVDGLRDQLREKHLDALLLSDIVNIGYVTGFTGSTAYAVVTPAEALLITDPRYTLRAREESPAFTLAVAQGSGGYSEALKKVVSERSGIKTLGFEANHVTVGLLERLRKELPAELSWTPTENVVENLRIVKDAGETAAIEAAIAIAQETIEAVKSRLRAGRSENEIALDIEFTMRRLGAQRPAFDTIVASGPNGARPHHTPSGRILEPGDLVTIDWGAELDGYCSDITRTFAIGTSDDISAEQKRIYETVREAQALAIAAIAPGKTGKEIDSVARDYIASKGYGDAFSHSLGHSLGRAVHDGQGLSSRSDKFILKPGMVMTIEPGIYVEGIGGVRIEEDILVTETGSRILTSLPREMEFLG